jgi:hypothetical protein
MKKNIIIMLFLLPILFITGCKDDFTSEDALNAQQTIDLSILVYDISTDSAIVGATVTIYNNGEELSVESNELGFANFAAIKIAEALFYQVQKEGYAKISSTMDIDVSNFRQGQFSSIVPMYSLTKNTAKITGKIEIETDFTNEESELAPEGTKVYAYADLDAIPVEFMGTVDTNGFYEIVVPAAKYGIDYQMRYETLVLTQTVAKNGDKGDPDFPETYPEIATISTTYNQTGNALAVPSVPSIYAYVDATTTGTIAVINNIDVNADGEITDLDWDTGGDGYTVDSVDIVIVSLFDGSGAVIRVDVDEAGDGAVQTGFSSMKIHNAGTEYPDFNEANQGRSNTSISFTSSVNNLYSGEVRVINGNYGSGVLRATEIQ